MSEDGNQAEPNLRRRAAVLLVLLVVVAGLFIAIMVVFIGTSGTKHAPSVGIDDPSLSQPASPSGAASTSRPPSTTTTSGSASTDDGTAPGAVTCPTAKACALQGDAGNLIPAINALREQHHQPQIAGAVTPAAQRCALTDGDDCPSGYAESYVPKPNGTSAAKKLLDRANLLDPRLTSISVGWAYDPGAKQYRVVIVDKF